MQAPEEEDIQGAVMPKAATLVVRLGIVLNLPLTQASLVTPSKEVGSDFVLPDDRFLNKRL
jgi:hypothetical protein